MNHTTLAKDQFVVLDGCYIYADSKICRVRLLFLRVGPAGTYFGCFIVHASAPPWSLEWTMALHFRPYTKVTGHASRKKK